MASIEWMPSPKYNLTEKETQTLQNENLVLGEMKREKRKISAALLDPPTSEASSTSTSLSNATASISRKKLANLEGTTFDWPEHLLSEAAIGFCGFAFDVASVIYLCFVNRSNQDNNLDDLDDLDDYMRAHIRAADFNDDLPPQNAMTRMSLTKDIQDAIINPSYEEIRETQIITS